MPFWDLQFIHKSEMKVLKSWSKSEILLRTTAVMKIFNFFTKFWLNLKLPEIIQIDIRTLLNAILRLAIHSQMWNESLEKLVKIWNFAKERGNENFQFFTKFWTQPQTSRNHSNEQENTPECHFESCNPLTRLKWKSWRVGQNPKFR